MGTNTFSIIRVGLLMKRNLMSREMNLQKVSSIMVLIVLFFFLPKVFIGKMFDLDAAHRSFLIFVLICGIVCSLQFYMGLWNRSAFISYWLLPANLSEKFVARLCSTFLLCVVYFLALLAMVAFLFFALYIVGNISQETVLDFYQTFFSSIYYLMSRQTELSFIGLCKCLVVIFFMESFTLLILTVLLYINRRFRLIFGLFLLILIILFSIVSFELCPTFFEYFWIQNMYFSFVVVSICFYAMSYYGFRNMQYKMWFNDVNKLER